MNPESNQSLLDNQLTVYAEDLLAENLQETMPDTEIDPDIRTVMIEDILERTKDHIMMNALAAMSPDELQYFEALTDADAPSEQIQGFIASTRVDMPAIVARSLIEFRAVYLGLVV